MKKKYISIIASISFLLLGLWQTDRFAKMTTDEVNSRFGLINEVPLSSIDRKVINAILLGQGQLYDNFVHLWTTQYLGSDEILEEDPVLVSLHLDKLLRLGIQSESFYLLSCFRFIFHFKTPELCEPIGHAGMKHMPDRWMISASLGYSYLVQKKFSEAAIYFQATASKPGAPKYFKTVGAKILEKNKIDLQIPVDILKEMETSESTKRIIKKLQNK